MSIFLNSITSKSDVQAILRQLEAARNAGIDRVGIFEKLKVGYDSRSYHIDIAMEIISSHIQPA